MKIGIDVREACRSNRTGKGQWTYGFVRELLQRDVMLTLFTDDELPPEWERIIAGSKGRVHVACYPRGWRWHLTVAAAFRKDTSIDVYLSTVSYIVPFLIGSSKRVVTVVHDLIAFMPGRHNRKAAFIERMTLKHIVKHAYYICTVSQATKRDILSRYPSMKENNVVPVYAAPSESIVQRSTNGKCILMIGTLSPRKNQLRLIEAYAGLPAKLKSEHDLILIGGRGWDDDEIVRSAERERNVTWIGFQQDEQCRRYMAEAAIFAFPSLYEGFGLPVLDAMRAGIPVLTSDRGSLKEVAGEAAVYVDPESITSIRGGLLALLMDPRKRAVLSEAGKKRSESFSWRKSTDLFLRALDDRMRNSAQRV